MILKGTIASVKDANFTDSNGNLYFWISLKESPGEVGQIAIRPGSDMKEGDVMFYSKEQRINSKKETYWRYHREKDPEAIQPNGGKPSGAYREDPYLKVVSMAMSYANDLAVAGVIDPSRVTIVAEDYLQWMWSRLDVRKNA